MVKRIKMGRWFSYDGTGMFLAFDPDTGKYRIKLDNLEKLNRKNISPTYSSSSTERKNEDKDNKDEEELQEFIELLNKHLQEVDMSAVDLGALPVESASDDEDDNGPSQSKSKRRPKN